MGKLSNLCFISLSELSMMAASQGCSLCFLFPKCTEILFTSLSFHMLCLCCSILALPNLHPASSYLPSMSHFAFVKNNFIYLFLAVLGLLCCTGFSLVAEFGDYSQLQCAGFLLRWRLLLQSTGSSAHGLQELQHVGSGVAAPQL